MILLHGGLLIQLFELEELPIYLDRLLRDKGEIQIHEDILKLMGLTIEKVREDVIKLGPYTKFSTIWGLKNED